MAKEYDLSQIVNPLEVGSEIDASQLVNPLQVGSEIDASGLVSPLPPGTPPLAAAPMGDGLSEPLVTGVPQTEALAAPATIDETSTRTTKGKDTTTTTENDTSRSYTEQSQGSKDAAALANQASLVERGYLEDEQKAKAKELEIEGALKEKEGLLTAKWQVAKARAREQGIADVKRDLDDINLKVAELTNAKPETFWGSKSQADKVMSAISVGLGSFAQATLGSGQNVGAVLLERQMNEFENGLKQKFQARVKQIDTLRATAEQKQQLLDEADKQYDAMRLGRIAQEQALLARAGAQAKTATVNAAIGQKMAKSMQDQAKVQLEVAQKYEQKVEQKTSSRVVENLKNITEETKSTKANPNGPNGKGGKRTAEQDKSLGFFNRMKDAQENIALLGDETQLAAKGALGKYFRDLEYNTASEDIPGVGGVLQAGRYALGDTAEDRLKRNDPESYNYVNQARNFMAAVLRKESGASISPKEFVEGYRIYFPQPGDGPREIAQKAKLRRQSVVDMGAAGGASD